MENIAPPNPKLLALLVTPGTHQSLEYRKEYGDLYSPRSGESYKITNGVPFVIRTTEEAQGMDYHAHYQQDAEIFDYFEERTGATEHDERRVHEYILSRVPKNTESVLDVGCGRAWVARHCLPKGMFVCSMDISSRNPAKALALYPSPNHAGLAADAFHLPFRDGAFDCIVASEIIEHVVDPAAFVHELLRVVKPGGSLIITTPYKEVLKYYICVHCNQPTPVNAHLHTFDENKLVGYAAGKERGQWKTFGNKALIYLRTYTLLRFLPFSLWKAVDALANALFSKPEHILVEYKKVS
jgi:SAM-dependent methyltransferase